MSIDLAQLPPPNVIETLDYETILAAMIDDLQAREPSFTALVESDPAYKVLEVAAYRELLLRARINDAALAVMLPYATAADLDNLGSYWGVERLEITPANTTTLPPTPAVMESDSALRRRILLSTEGQTNAGTEDAYIFQTLSADGRVKDATAHSPQPGQVRVTVLSEEDNGTPTDDLMATVTEHLNQPHIRQLTDELIVQKATVTNYRVKADLYISAGPGADQVMQAAHQAVETYAANHRLGTIVPVSGIYSALQQPGVSRVVLHEPSADLLPTIEQAGYCTAIELTQQQDDPQGGGESQQAPGAQLGGDNDQ